MANLTVDPTRVAVVKDIWQTTLPASVAINAGQIIRMDTTTGQWVLALATTAPNAGNRRFVAVKTVTAGMPLTGIRKGVMDLGEAVAALAFDTPVYLSDTAGTWSDTVGTVTVLIGTVVPAFASGANVDRLVSIDL